jgi:predicted nucleic acid-binding protein
VTDAHLLAVARRHDARLATFDRGIAALDDHGIVELIAVR